jgi:release factor glutamine methyltransferase
VTATRALIAAAIDRLAAAGVPSPRVDAETLAAHVTGMDRRQLVFAEPMSAEQTKWFAALVERRAAREPLQHLTGRAPFRHLELVVGPGVFIPRPETELVAQAAIDEVHRLVRRRGGHPLVVDLGTGSGAIALAVATEAPAARIHAIELDPTAHSYAARNLAGRDNVTLQLVDAAEALPDLDGTMDVVVANPPYVPLTSAAELDPEVADHEPAVALFGGPDGLAGPRTVVAAALRLLRPGGLLVMEHDAGHGASVTALLGDPLHWADVTDQRDLTGRARFVTARRSGGAEQ